MKKEVFIIGIVIFVALIILFFWIQSPDISVLKKDLCMDETEKVVGHVEYSEKMNITKEKYEELKLECEQNGTFVDIFCRQMYCNLYCTKLFSDGGKDCTDSSQCEGVCLPYSGCLMGCGGVDQIWKIKAEYGEQVCGKSYVGYCQLKDEAICGENFELANGKIVSKGSMECD